MRLGAKTALRQLRKGIDCISRLPLLVHVLHTSNYKLQEHFSRCRVYSLESALSSHWLRWPADLIGKPCGNCYIQASQRRLRARLPLRSALPLLAVPKRCHLVAWVPKAILLQVALPLSSLAPTPLSGRQTGVAMAGMHRGNKGRRKNQSIT